MADIEGRNHYELLGLEPGATTEAIKEAYREIARIYHPDSNFYDDIIADTGPDDSAVFKAITAAYQVLVNEEKRRAYDDTLPKGLNDWGEEDPSGGSTRMEARESHDHEDDEDIPEEWKKEREFFAENFEEILKPGPRSNLVAGGGEVPKPKIPADDGSDPFGPWEEEKIEVQAGTRFGDLSDEKPLPDIDALPAARRIVEPGGTKDPFLLLMYFGIPLMTLVVLVELIWLKR
jgi:DnaJ-class molecular chaperone